MCSAIRFVGNGTNAMHMSRQRLITMNVRSAVSICRMHAWWLTHMIPIVTNETA